MIQNNLISIAMIAREILNPCVTFSLVDFSIDLKNWRSSSFLIDIVHLYRGKIHIINIAIFSRKSRSNYFH